MRGAVIGCGFFAQNHLNAWRDMRADGVEVVAVCDLDIWPTACASLITASQIEAPVWLSQKFLLTTSAGSSRPAKKSSTFWTEATAMRSDACWVTPAI